MALHRNIIRITAEDSPNVRQALSEIEEGKAPTNTTVVPGLLSYRKYLIRRRTWDTIKQCIGLDAKFWEGKDTLMFPDVWLQRAALIADDLRKQGRKRYGLALGVDPGEGSANTSMVCGDELGALGIRSEVTEDTSSITDMTIDFARQWVCDMKGDGWVFDAGGGGREHVDRLRRIGYKSVDMIAFGSAPQTKPKHGQYTVGQRLAIHEDKAAYTNRRAQMYYEARCLFDPSLNPQGYGLPLGGTGKGHHAWKELHRQLALIPLWYDQNGKVFLPPKNRKQMANSGADGSRGRGGFAGSGGSSMPTMTDIVGNSPDEADAFVLMVHRLLHGSAQVRAGTMRQPNSGGDGKAGASVIIKSKR